MENSKEPQLTDIAKNIKEMRKAMDAGTHAFRHIYRARNLRLLFLVAGCLVVFFTITYHVLLNIYDYHTLIPKNVMAIYWVILFISWLMLVGLRTHLTLKAGRELIKNLSVWGLIKLILSSRIWLAVVPVLFVLSILPFKIFPYLPKHFYIPYIAIVSGIICNMGGVGIRVFEYSVMGYWLIITGLIGVFLIVMPVHIAVAINFAPACFLFAIMAFTNRKRSNYDNR
ncbi:MAG: hypothetical protein GY850_33010 [bacterium]|nr:hypothetical protein [bacterium]